jgi:Arsenite efflux pump ACR3 and related permeases
VTAAWTGLTDGELEGASRAMAVNLLAAVLLPAYLSGLVSGDIAVDPAALYRQLGIVVAAPMVAGAVTRRLLLSRDGSRTFERIRPLLGDVSSVGVTLIVFVAMAMWSTSVLADPVVSLGVVVPLVASYGVVLGVGVLVGRAVLAPPQAMAVVYARSIHNLSIGLALAVTPGFPPTEAAPLIALECLLRPPLGALYMHYRCDVVGQDRSLRELIEA